MKIILDKEELLQFFGKMALPPWTDEKGKQIGENINCAIIASEISDWVDLHSINMSQKYFEWYMRNDG